tara:strand:+ start:9086 stop:9505 length:420 start_codon:yes stop_codon:yes gene_type:complete
MEKCYSMPLYLHVRRRKGIWVKDSLNFNEAKKWNYRLQHKLKMEYEKLAGLQIRGDKFGIVEIVFTLIPPDNIRRDRANFTSIHEKFFCDALVKNKALKDDNDFYIKRSIHETGPIDKGKGRVEITVRDIHEKEPIRPL